MTMFIGLNEAGFLCDKLFKANVAAPVNHFVHCTGEFHSLKSSHGQTHELIWPKGF